MLAAQEGARTLGTASSSHGLSSSTSSSSSSYLAHVESELEALLGAITSAEGLSACVELLDIAECLAIGPIIKDCEVAASAADVNEGVTQRSSSFIAQLEAALGSKAVSYSSLQASDGE